MKRLTMKKRCALLALLVHSSSFSSSLEVLHWWTAPGEVEALQVLQDTLASSDVSWQDFAIVGSGGASAMRVLQMRALSGNPPDVAQIKGPDIGEWSKIGMLKAVEPIVDNAIWDEHLPDIVKQAVSYQGQYMAVPLNVHRVNWLWLNKAIFEELALPVPTTWEAFFSSADKIQQAGYIALSHGGTSWQDSLLFESVALSLLGAEQYRQAFVHFNEAVLTSDKMIKALVLFKRLNHYVDSKMRGQDWVVSSQMLTDKKAAMLLMGDWAKGVWQSTGKIAMQDYLCVDVPGEEKAFSYNIDSFVFFKQQRAIPVNISNNILTNALLSDQFQTDFNRYKGSLPVRNNMDLTAFDACTKKSYADFNSVQLVPSFSQNMATSSYLQIEMSNIISNYFTSETMSAKQASQQLALAIRAVNK